MIYKELDRYEGKAHEQMADRLRYAFGGSLVVDVVNGLVLRTGAIHTQMHHLIIHPYGMILVENVDLPGTISIDANWHWVHSHQGEATQIPSPVTETKIQALALEAYLDKKVKQKSYFHSLELDVLVAVPDVAAITWPRSGAFPEVCNADQVPNRIKECVADYRRDAGTQAKLVPNQRQRLAEFLRASHKGVGLPKLVTNGDDRPSTRGSDLGPASGPDWLPSSRTTDLS